MIVLPPRYFLALNLFIAVTVLIVGRSKGCRYEQG